MNKIIAIEVIVLVSLVSYYFLFMKPKSVVLADNPVATTTPTPLPSPTDSPTPTPTPTPSPTLKPTATPVPAPKYTSQEINQFVDRFSAQYGVDPNVMRHIAICESGFEPLAKNGPNWGLYQFVSTTWSSYRRRMGENRDPNLRLDAEEAAQTAAYAFSLGNGKIWPNCQP